MNSTQEMKKSSKNTKKVLISGYYGFNNSGDEAVLWSIIGALRRVSEQTGMELQPVVLSANPAETTRQYGVKAVHRMKLNEILSAIRQCDALISGGGSLLQDVTSSKTIPYYLAIIKLAQWMKKPTFIYAQGIGPINRPIFQRMAGRVLKKCSYVSVRDEESALLLHSYGLDPEKVHVVSDPVLGISANGANEDEVANRRNGVKGEKSPSTSDSSQHTSVSEMTDNRSTEDRSDTDDRTDHDAENKIDGVPVIGVSVRYWNQDLSDLQAVADALTKIIQSKQVRVEFLPFHMPDDRKASEWVVEKIREKLKTSAHTTDQYDESSITIREIGPHPEDMVRAVAGCDVLVGMRLHSLIYATATYVPVVGVTYDPKIDHFLSRIQSAPATSTERPDANRIYEELNARIEKGPQWIADRKSAIEQLKKKADVPAQQIFQYLRI